MFLGERPAEGALGKTPAKLADLGIPVRGAVPGAGQGIEPVCHVAGRFEGCLGGRLVPFLGNGGAALPAVAAVVRRKRRGQRERFGRGNRKQGPHRDRVAGLVRGLPCQLDRRLNRRRRFGTLLLRVIHALLGLGVFQAERIGSAADQEDRAPIFAVVAGLHPGVDQRPIQVVQPEPGRVLGADDEFVIAGLRGQQRPGPADGKLVRFGLAFDRPVGAEVETHLRVDPFLDAVLVAEAALLEILRAEAAPLVPSHRGAEAAHQVGDGVAILADGEPGQGDPRRPIPFSGDQRIKCFVDVRRHALGLRGRQAAGSVLRHGPGNHFRQVHHRLVADERLPMPFGALPLGPVAGDALSPIELLTGGNVGRLGEGTCEDHARCQQRAANRSVGKKASLEHGRIPSGGRRCGRGRCWWERQHG